MYAHTSERSINYQSCVSPPRPAKRHQFKRKSYVACGYFWICLCIHGALPCSLPLSFLLSSGPYRASSPELLLWPKSAPKENSGSFRSDRTTRTRCLGLYFPMVVVGLGLCMEKRGNIGEERVRLIEEGKWRAEGRQNDAGKAVS